jgi:hypothetical protein
MRGALFIARMDLRRALRGKDTLVWLFVMPIVFFYFIGTVTGGFAGGGGGEHKDPIFLQAGGEPGFLLDELTQQLEENDYEVRREVDPEYEGPRVEVPERFTERVLAGEETELTLHRDGGSLMGDYDEFRVGRATYTLLASLVASAEEGEEPTPDSLARLRAMPRALTLDVKPAGRRKRVPRGFEQTIPGTMVMFTLVVLMTSGAVLMVIERRGGLLRRLASAPISRGQVVLGKWLGLLGLGLVQVSFGMVAGTLLFDMDWGPDLAMVCLVLLVWAMLVASMTMVLGSLARSEGQAVAIGVLSANVLAALGGCWWPIEVTPGWMQRLQLFLPTGWAMDALHKLAIFQLGAGSAALHVLGMGAAALLCCGVATRLFRFQ